MRAERIKYPMGALTAEGALIYDENVLGRRPAVLVAPNWMGMTDKAIQRVNWSPRIATWFSLPTWCRNATGRFRRGGRLSQSVAR